MTSRKAAHPHRVGFTLVEAVATIAIIAALGSVSSTLVLTAIDGYTRSATAAQLHSEASIALDRIDRLLRNIAADGGSPEISSVTATSITWETNSTLSLSNGNIVFIDEGGPQRVLLGDVASFQIRAFDESNSAMAVTLNGAACEDIRRIAVAVTLERSGVTQSLRTKVFLRCMSSHAGGS